MVISSPHCNLPDFLFQKTLMLVLEFDVKLHNPYISIPNFENDLKSFLLLNFPGIFFNFYFKVTEDQSNLISGIKNRLLAPYVIKILFWRWLRIISLPYFMGCTTFSVWKQLKIILTSILGLRRDYLTLCHENPILRITWVIFSILIS